MKFQTCLVMVSIFVLFGCTDDNAVKGNGKPKSEVRAVARFNKLNAHLNSYFTIPPCRYSVTISAISAPPASGRSSSALLPVRISADENILPLISTTVVGDQLKIDLTQTVTTDLGIQIEFWNQASVASVGCTTTMMEFGGTRPW